MAVRVDRKVRQMIDREISRYSGVSITVETGGKHNKVCVHFNGAVRRIPAPASASCYRAPLNFRADLRRVLHDMGATPNG